MPPFDRDDIDRREFVKAVGVAGAASGLAAVGGATPGREPGPKADEVLVGVSQGRGEPAAVVSGYTPDHAEVVHENVTLGYAAVAFDDDAPDDAQEQFIESVQEKPGVKYAEFNATHEALYTPDDPKFGDQYAPQMVNADDAWDTTLGDSSVVISIVDTGIQYDHEDLSGSFGTDEGYDFVDDDDDPYPDDQDKEYHGTHVGGIASAVTDNGTGVAGVSNSTLLSARALNEDGSGSTSDIADAVQWSADQGAEIVNMSLGGGGYTSTMKNAVDYAHGNGVFLAAAAGNDGEQDVSYPAAYAECLAVSALDSDGTLASYSNYGDDIELAAPGTDVLSTTTDARGSYEKLSGTSMATPVVSGTGGLALAAHSISNVELRAHLKETAVDIGLSREKQGNGRVDADNAVDVTPNTTHTTASVSDSLSDYTDSDCWYYSWEYSTPTLVDALLEGPTDADFDLYVTDGEGTCPTTSDYDYKSYSTDSTERITIDDPDDSTDLYLLVDSWSGSGDYTLSITEYD